MLCIYHVKIFLPALAPPPWSHLHSLPLSFLAGHINRSCAESLQRICLRQPTDEVEKNNQQAWNKLPAWEISVAWGHWSIGKIRHDIFTLNLFRNGDTQVFYEMLKVFFKDAAEQELEMTSTVFSLPLHYSHPIMYSITPLSHSLMPLLFQRNHFDGATLYSQNR